ncbi:unnamed protein product, partial [marine sediment metagenome]
YEQHRRGILINKPDRGTQFVELRFFFTGPAKKVNTV